MGCGDGCVGVGGGGGDGVSMLTLVAPTLLLFGNDSIED